MVSFLSPQRRPAAPGTSPTSTVFSPPPPLPLSGDTSATPGKSNLKQTSQFERKDTWPSGAPPPDNNLLPEIPTIEVLSVSGDEEGGEGSKVGKTSVKGVRFADEVKGGEGEREREEEGEKVVTSFGETSDSSPPVAPTGGSSGTKKAGEGEQEELMDSVDFDKVTGTSTPIAEESPSLTKRGAVAPDSHNLSSSPESSSAVEDREDVIVGEEGGRESKNTAHSKKTGSDSETTEGVDVKNSAQDLAQVSSSTAVEEGEKL